MSRISLFERLFQFKCNSKDLEFMTRKRLSEVVDDLLFNEYILQNDIVALNDLSLSVMLNLNVLSSSLKDEIFSQCHSVLIVAANDDSELVKCFVTKT